MLVALLAAVPCKASESGCGGHLSAAIGVAVLVLIFAAAVTGVLAWIWFRWDRGPFWKVVRVLTRTRK